MGESRKQGFQLSFNRFLRVAFQGSRVTSNGGLILVRELDERLEFGELIEQHLTDSRANNCAVVFRGPAAAVGLQPLGGLRGPQQRRAGVGRSDLSLDRLGEELESRRGLDFDLAWIRDGNADERRQLTGADGVEPGAGRASRGRRQIRVRRAGHGFQPRAPSTANRKGALTTAISSRSATTRCCY